MLNIMMSNQFKILSEETVSVETIFMPQVFALVPVFSAVIIFDLAVAMKILVFIILFFYGREVYKTKSFNPRKYGPNFCFFLSLLFLWLSGIAYVLYLEKIWTVSGIVPCLVPFLFFLAFGVVGGNNYHDIKYHRPRI